MPKRDNFNIHNLYPADYCFDWETFYKDPEGYQFTEADIAYFNARELARYEEEVPMTPYEKKLLRQWVISGHSPLDNAGSRYVCLSGSESLDFLDVYRMDREIREATKGMNRKEKDAYLKSYIGWTDDDPIETSEWLPVEENKDMPFAKF